MHFIYTPNMKMKQIIRFAVLQMILAFFTTQSYAQCVVGSTDGYFVTISVNPAQIIPASSSCEFGYSYTVRLNYSISFSGKNIPSSLYTLQGTLNCGGSSIFFDLPNNGGTGNTISSNAYTSLTNCSNATPGSLGCNNIQLQIEGPGIPAQTISCPLSAALPVQFASFEVKTTGTSQALINWSTAWEENNGFFTVERSVNGTDFTALAKVDGKGNSSTANWYNYTDNGIYPGSFYYRIRQTDLNGTFSFTDVKKISLTQNNRLAIAPNPVAGTDLFIQGLGSDLKGTKAQLFNTNGHLLYSAVVRDARMKLPANITAGNYVLILINDKGERNQLRFVKL